MLRDYQSGISDKGVPFPARTKLLTFLQSEVISCMSDLVYFPEVKVVEMDS